MKALFNFLVLTVAPGAAFYGGYALTEYVFRVRLIPYPFESYGLAAGGACFFWTLSLLVWLFGKRKI